MIVSCKLVARTIVALDVQKDQVKLLCQDLGGRRRTPLDCEELLFKSAPAKTSLGAEVSFPCTPFLLQAMKRYADWFGEKALAGRSLVALPASELKAARAQAQKPRLPPSRKDTCCLFQVRFVYIGFVEPGNTSKFCPHKYFSEESSASEAAQMAVHSLSCQQAIQDRKSGCSDGILGELATAVPDRSLLKRIADDAWEMRKGICAPASSSAADPCTRLSVLDGGFAEGLAGDDWFLAV